MKYILNVLCLIISLSLNSQSYLDSEGQKSLTITSNYFDDFHWYRSLQLQSVLTINNTLDLHSTVGIGRDHHNFANKVFTSAFGGDVYLLKLFDPLLQNNSIDIQNTLPIEFSIGATYDFTKYSYDIDHIGIIKSNLYFTYELDNFSIIPILGYSRRYNLRVKKLRSQFIETGAAFALQLEKNKLMFIINRLGDLTAAHHELIIQVGYHWVKQ